MRWSGIFIVAVLVACGSDDVTTTNGSGLEGGSGGTGAAGGSGGTGGSGAGPTTCPVALPVEGSPCMGTPMCAIDVDPGPCGGAITVNATCVPNGDGISLWELDLSDCNGDPAGCSGYDHPSICVADTSCRYLTQGCGNAGEPMLETGCYANFDCMPGSCMTGTCTDVTFDPCHNFCPQCATCGACGASASLCL